MVLHGRKSDSGTESGFTLIEVLMAMAILAVGLLSIAVAQLTAIKVSARSKNLQQAMFLAREQMDDLEALPMGAPALSAAGTVNDPGNPLKATNDPEDNMTFNRSVTVAPNVPAPGLAQITVRVVWNAPQGGISQVQLASVKRMN